MATLSKRNKVSPGVMASYLIGLVCTIVGIYLVEYTRINLVTAQTSSPHVGIGIVLIVVGIVTIIIAQRMARQMLKK